MKIATHNCLRLPSRVRVSRVFFLGLLLTVLVAPHPAFARQYNSGNANKAYRKASKKAQKGMRKYQKQQQKAMKKSAKQQKKTLKRSQRNNTHY